MTLWSNAKIYHLVDMWQHQTSNYNDTANVDDSTQEEIFKEAQWRMAKFVNRTQAVFHRNTSVDVALGFPDASVDFIYLDARHDYCGVTEDLHAWYPKLRVGGIMAGEDAPSTFTAAITPPIHASLQHLPHPHRTPSLSLSLSVSLTSYHTL